MNIFHAGRAFYLNQIPQPARDGIQDIGVGVAAVEGESGFIKRSTLLNGMFRCVEDFVEIFDPFGNFDSAGERLL
jgi:hypothetical protein